MDFKFKFLIILTVVTAILAGLFYLIKRPRGAKRKKPEHSSPSNELETKIFLAATDTYKREETFCLLAGSRLFVLGSISPDNKLALKHWSIDGKPLIPAFTSLERLREAISHQEHYIEIDALTFLKSIPGNSDVVLNPNSRFSMELKHGEIVKILEAANKGR